MLAWAALAGAVLAACSTSKKPSFEPALVQSRQYFQAGEYQKAIETNAAVSKTYPAEQAVREEFTKTLEGIDERGRAAMAAADYATAEKLFSILLNNFDQYKGLEKSLSFSAAGLNRRIRLCRTALAEQRTSQYLQAGDYEKALGAQSALSPSELRDPAVAESFSKTMQEIKRRADGAAAARNYGDAGRAYAVLAARYADAARLGQKLPFTKEALNQGVNRCRAELTRQGLEHYRKGELSRAISVWQDLLRFDPDNTEIRKAVETARQQQKELRKK